MYDYYSENRAGCHLRFAFVNFLNTDQSHSEDVSFSMPGRACQDGSVVIYDRTRQSGGLEDNIQRYLNSPVMVDTFHERHKPLFFMKECRWRFQHQR